MANVSQVGSPNDQSAAVENVYARAPRGNRVIVGVTDPSEHGESVSLCSTWSAHPFMAKQGAVSSDPKTDSLKQLMTSVDVPYVESVLT